MSTKHEPLKNQTIFHFASYTSFSADHSQQSNAGTGEPATVLHPNVGRVDRQLPILLDRAHERRYRHDESLGENLFIEIPDDEPYPNS